MIDIVINNLKRPVEKGEEGKDIQQQAKNCTAKEHGPEAAMHSDVRLKSENWKTLPLHVHTPLL